MAGLGAPGLGRWFLPDLQLDGQLEQPLEESVFGHRVTSCAHFGHYIECFIAIAQNVVELQAVKMTRELPNYFSMRDESNCIFFSVSV